MARPTLTIALTTFSAFLICALASSESPSGDDCEHTHTSAPYRPTRPTSSPPTTTTTTTTTPPPSRCSAPAPSWSDTYFEPSIVQSRLPITPADVAFEANASGLGLPCGTTLPGSTHVVGCRGVIGGGWTLDPPHPPQATIVYLPGWSSDLERKQSGPTGVLIPFFAKLIADAAPAFDRVRFVTPIPPFRNVTTSPFPEGPSAPRSWFDMLQVPTAATIDAVASLPEDRLGVYRAVERIAAVVENERCEYNVSADRVFLYGHSFGAAAGYAVAMRTDIPFAGVYLSSGFLPFAGDLISRGAQAFNVRGKGYEVTIAHGTNDTTVPFAFGALSANLTGGALAPLGAKVDFVPFPGEGHTTLFGSAPFAKSFVAAIQKAFS